MEHGTIILKLLRAHLQNDHELFVSYTEFLAEKIEEKEPDSHMARAIRRYLTGDFGTPITTSEARSA